MFKEDTRKEFKVKQVWICGPPVMSDNFDKDFQSLINERIDDMQRKLDEAMMNRYAKQKVMAPLDTTMAMNEKQDTDGRTYELDLETQYDIIWLNNTKPYWIIWFLGDCEKLWSKINKADSYDT